MCGHDNRKGHILLDSFAPKTNSYNILEEWQLAEQQTHKGQRILKQERAHGLQRTLRQ